MMAGPSSADIVRLPGPARFISRATADLATGKSVILVFPDATVASGTADAVLEDLATEGMRTAFCIESTDPFPARVLATFGADQVRETDAAEWDTIIDWEPWHGSWVFIPGWEHDDAAEIIDRWPAQLNACGLTADDRPKLIIGVRLADLPRTKITHVDRNSVAVHWWWGVLDRLDTELRLATTFGATLSSVHTAVIVEVSGWDLACTDFLASEWDRTTSGIYGTLRDYREQAGGSSDIPAITRTRGGPTAPPAELEKSWREGMVDWWGHGVRWTAIAADNDEVRRRLWMAHNRALIQYVDEERAHFEEMILKKAARDTLNDLRHRDDDIIEIGSLAWLIETRRVDLGKADRERLQTFRNLRNALAHRKPVGDELMRRVVSYLEF